MSSLTDTFARALAHRPWSELARPAQLPPPGRWTVWFMCAGRGAGKTRAASEWVGGEVMGGRAHRVAVVARTAADVRDTCIEGASGLLAVAPQWFRPTYEPSKRRLTWPNGAVATTFSADEPDLLRGPQFDLAWCDELASWERAQETWDNLQLALRLGSSRVVISSTPKPIPLVRALLARDRKDVAVTRMTTFENLDNLSAAFGADVVARYRGTHFAKQELLGELVVSVPGALWTPELLGQTRRAQPPTRRVQRADGQWEEVLDFTRVAIGVDPSVSGDQEGAAETGIVVAALGRDGHGYVLEDGSLSASPDTWARRVVTLYHKWRADRVVAEVNQGGQLVRRCLETVDRTLPITTVHAARSKEARAEPIAALFEQNRAHLVGTWPALEEQLTCWTPGSGESPDRLDALVWTLTTLFMVPPTLEERLAAMTDAERRDYHFKQASLAARIFEIS